MPLFIDIRVGTIATGLEMLQPLQNGRWRVECGCLQGQLTGIFFESHGCSSEYSHCRMKCETTEYAIRYCEDWTICCRSKEYIKSKRTW
ncbi:defensin beta 43 [Cricetulus griseus]